MTRLDALEKLLDEATPEPKWTAFVGCDDDGNWGACGPSHDVEDFPPTRDDDDFNEADAKAEAEAENDCRLIRAAPEALRQLLAVARAAQARRKFNWATGSPEQLSATTQVLADALAPLLQEAPHE